MEQEGPSGVLPSHLHISVANPGGAAGQLLRLYRPCVLWVARLHPLALFLLCCYLCDYFEKGAIRYDC